MIGTGTEIRVLGRPADDGKKAKALSGQSAIADSSDTIESGQDEIRHHCEDKLARYKRYKLPRKLVSGMGHCRATRPAIFRST